LVQLGEELPPDFEPQILFLPLAQAPPAGAGTGVLLGQITPPRPGLEHPKNAFQDPPIVGPRPASTVHLRQQRFEPAPLFVRQECFLHPQFFTKSFVKYKYKMTYKKSTCETTLLC
jgi:hypothetical protein